MTLGCRWRVQGFFIKPSQDSTHSLDERMDVRALTYGLTHGYTLLKLLAGGGAGCRPDGKSASPTRQPQ
jgi:hypothetical protein